VNEAPDNLTSDVPKSVNVYFTHVRSHQTDLNRAMYHGAYFDVFDDARIDVFRRLDYTYERSVREGWFPVIRRVQCEYFAPARMDDPITITVLVPQLTKATMTIRYEARRNDTLLAIGQVVFAFLDASGRPVRLPAPLRALVLATEALGPTAA
jgi:acyl-CoA thioester hydrolase